MYKSDKYFNITWKPGILKWNQKEKERIILGITNSSFFYYLIREITPGKWLTSIYDEMDGFWHELRYNTYDVLYFKEEIETYFMKINYKIWKDLYNNLSLLTGYYKLNYYWNYIDNYDKYHETIEYLDQMKSAISICKKDCYNHYYSAIHKFKMDIVD